MAHPAVVACVAGIAGTWCAATWAALGADVDSIQRDRMAIHAPVDVVTPRTRYDLHEATTADGLALRQYVDRSGKVFALAWQGPRSPDVDTLLGRYASSYRAAQTGRGNHHVLTVRSGDLEVTILRLPRGWQGQAVLIGSLPEGVDRSELR